MLWKRPKPQYAFEDIFFPFSLLNHRRLWSCQCSVVYVLWRSFLGNFVIPKSNVIVTSDLGENKLPNSSSCMGTLGTSYWPYKISFHLEKKAKLGVIVWVTQKHEPKGLIKKRLMKQRQKNGKWYLILVLLPFSSIKRNWQK